MFQKFEWGKEWCNKFLNSYVFENENLLLKWPYCWLLHCYIYVFYMRASERCKEIYAKCVQFVMFSVKFL